MSLCGRDASPECDEPPSVDDAATFKEGKWVGITIGLWMLILLVAWVVRTCSRPDKRQKILRKLLFCYGKQHWSGTTAASNHGGENGSAGYNGHPPSYREAVGSDFTLDNVLHDEMEMSDHDSDDEYDDELGTAPKRNSTDVNGNNTKNGRFRKRLSRCSISSLTITLATIEEDVNEGRHNSQPEFHVPELSPTTLHNKSKSLPAELSCMAGQETEMTLDIEPTQIEDETGNKQSNGIIICSVDICREVI